MKFFRYRSKSVNPNRGYMFLLQLLVIIIIFFLPYCFLFTYFSFLWHNIFCLENKIRCHPLYQGFYRKRLKPCWPEVGPAPNFFESLDLSDIVNNTVTSLKLQSVKKRINLKESISSHVEFAKKVSIRTRNLFTVTIVDFGYINRVRG